MTDIRAKEALARVGIVQTEKGLHMCCPRCGENSMDENLYHNAYSRHADCYICAECGTDEAMRDYSGNPLPLNRWGFIVNVLDVINGEQRSEDAE